MSTMSSEKKSLLLTSLTLCIYSIYLRGDKEIIGMVVKDITITRTFVRMASN